MAKFCKWEVQVAPIDMLNVSPSLRNEVAFKILMVILPLREKGVMADRPCYKIHRQLQLHDEQFLECY